MTRLGAMVVTGALIAGCARDVGPRFGDAGDAGDARAGDAGVPTCAFAEACQPGTHYCLDMGGNGPNRCLPTPSQCAASYTCGCVQPTATCPFMTFCEVPATGLLAVYCPPD